MPVCSKCGEALERNSYAEIRAEIHDGALAATKLASLGYVCLNCLDGHEPKKAKVPKAPPKRRGRKPKPKPPRQPCGCGCGRLANHGKTYLRGHARRGKKKAA